jgi:ubiquitin C-terminal hydrolase
MGCELFDNCLNQDNTEINNEVTNKKNNFPVISIEKKEEFEKKDGVQQNELIKHNEILEQISIIKKNIKIEKEENIEQNEQKRRIEKDEISGLEERRKLENESQLRDNEFHQINQLYGFINNGNNCYLNSSLQLLTRVKELRENILNVKSENICIDTITEGKICVEFQNIVQHILNGKKNIDPRKLKKVMGGIDERYKDNNQEDANEFISNFLDGLLDEIGDKNNLPEPLDIKNESDKAAYDKFYKRFYKIKGNSFLLDLFYSIIKTQKVCQSCSNVNSIKFNAFNIIELPIKCLAKRGNDIKFEDIIDNYLKKNENINGECKFCGSNNIYEKINIYSLPKYLILYFGRTIDNYYIDNQIIYPYKYTFESFINNDTDYNLECVIEHSGGAHYGHYTSLCPINKVNKWYKFSDTTFYENHSDYHGSNAIILLYKQKTN